MAAYPLIFEPIYKPKLWGGNRIFTHFGRAPVVGDPVGESWELADLESEASRVAAGPMAGKTLTELVRLWGRDLLGGAGLFEGRFPLLIKFLDARESLSVQVHPNEAVVRRLGGAARVKHEAWYVLASEPGGVIYHGLEPGVTAESFRQAMLAGRIEGVVRKVNARPGNCYYLPSGTCHALGAGVLVAEVQTPSDVTYRAYDWGRIEPGSGHPRELHLDQTIECIDFDRASTPPMQERSHIANGSVTVSRLVKCPSFLIEKVRMAEGTQRRISTGEPTVWIILEGKGQMDWQQGARPLPLARGNVVLLPAGLSSDAHVQIHAPTQWLEVTVPVPHSLSR